MAMQLKKIAVFLIGMLSIISLAACQNANAHQLEQANAENLAIEMELDADYDDADPFVDARLFCVSDDVAALEAEGTVQLEGASGILAIKDNRTKEILWQKTWDERTDEDTFSISLENIKQENEYVVSFTGTKINYAKIAVTFASPFVEERVRPLK